MFFLDNNGQPFDHRETGPSRKKGITMTVGVTNLETCDGLPGGAFETLVEKLQSSEFETRVAAVIALGDCQHERAVGELIQILEEEEVPLQLHAAEALGK